MSKIQRIVISGGPGTGKTSIIDTLSKKGLNIFNEVARKVIKEQLAIGSSSLPWDNLKGFSKLVYQEQAHDFQNAKPGLNFYDRSSIDIIAYLNFGSVEDKELISSCSSLEYSETVFIAPPWQEIYLRDQERRENLTQLHAIDDSIRSAYSKLNYNIIDIPKLSIEQRVDFILENLSDVK